MRPEVLLKVLLITWPGAAAAQVAIDDFWWSSDMLEIEIETDARGIRVEDREENAAPRPGVLRMPAEAVEVEVRLRTRGHFRLDPRNCRYPPLSVEIPGDSAIPSALIGMGTARIVWPCRSGQEDLTRLEYAAYRLRLVLDDWGYRVRPVTLTFVDATGRDDPLVTFAFLREGDGHLRRRLAVEEVEIPDSIAANPAVLPSGPATLNEVFEYMIGNTDWSVSARHNHYLVRTGDGEYRTVLYDFDFSGLVNAPYAAPAAAFSLKSVTERLYRGLCRPPEVFGQAIDTFVAKESEFMTTLEAVPGLSGAKLRDAKRYLNGFFFEAHRRDRMVRTLSRNCIARN